MFLHDVCLENSKCRIIGFTLILKLQSLKKMFDQFELIDQAVKVKINIAESLATLPEILLERGSL